MPGLIAFLILGLAIYAVCHEAREDSVGGLLSFRPGREYGFKTGDNIRSYGAYGTFNGLDLRLPIEMPHIYLDSLKAGGHEVSAVFDFSQRIKLEGDFSNYFNVLVPRNYEAVALSILSPDVMETLQKYAADFDVEIYGDHLRVISNRKVSKDVGLQAKLVEVAEKILKEIEDRQRSWTQSNTLMAINQDLHIYPNPGYRVFGRYITRKRILLSIFWLMCTAGFVFSGVLLILDGQYAGGTGLIILTALLYAGLQGFTSGGQRSERFWSRRG